MRTQIVFALVDLGSAGPSSPTLAIAAAVPRIRKATADTAAEQELVQARR